MAIETVDEIVKALAGNFTRFVIDKNSIINQTIATSNGSSWRINSIPAQAAIPTTAVITTSATLGAIPFTNQTLPMKAYLGYADYVTSVGGTPLIICDRLAQQGGLSLNVLTSQTTNLPINLGTLGVVADRLGAANYSEVQWFLECYTDGGATASNATINVTYDDDTTGNLSVIAVGGSLRNARAIPLNSFIPVDNKRIKGINSVILSAATGTAGNFGFTAVREIVNLSNSQLGSRENFDWARLGLPVIPNDACLFGMIIPLTALTGYTRVLGKIIYG